MQIQNGSGPHAGNALPVRGFNQQRANLFAQHAAALVNSINDQRQQLDTLGGRVQEITANVQAVANANTLDDRNLVTAEGAVHNLNADAAMLRLDVDRNRRDSSVLDTAAQLLVELQDANMEFDRSADGSLKILINLGASAGGIVYAIYISPMIPVTGSALLNGSIRALMAVARKGQASTTKEFFSEFITGFLSCLAVAGVTKHISLPMIKFLGLKHQYSRELAGKILSDAVVNVVEKKCTGKEILIKDIALRALGSLAGDLAAEGLPLLIGEPRDSLERVLMAAGSGAVRSAVNHLVTNLCDNKKSWKDSLFESAVFEAILSAVMEARQIHYENHQRVVEPHIKPEVKPDSKGDQGEVNKPNKPDNKDKGEKPVKKDKKEKGGKPVKKDKKEKGGKPVKKDKKEKGEKPTKKDDKDNADKPGKKDDNNDPGDVNGATGGSLPPLNKPNIEGAVDVLTKEGYVDTNKPVLADNRNTIDRLKNGEEIKLVKPDGSFVKLKLVDGKLQVIVRGNYGILKKVEDAANALPNVPSPSPDAPAPSNQNANDGHAVAKSATTHNPEDKNRLQAQTPLNQVAPPPQPQAPVNEVAPPPQPQAPVNEVAPPPQPQAPVNEVAPPPQPQAPVNQVAPAPQPQEVHQNDEDDSDEEGAQVVPQQPLLNIVQQPVFNPQLRNGVNQPVLPVVMANFGVNQVKAARHLQRLERQLKSLPTGKRGRARRVALSMQIQELQRNRT